MRLNFLLKLDETDAQDALVKTTELLRDLDGSLAEKDLIMRKMHPLSRDQDVLTEIITKREIIDNLISLIKINGYNYSFSLKASNIFIADADYATEKLLPLLRAGEPAFI